ncbi:MAG: 50S ribosomal protein L5 [Candidatus Pacebacteria bacterium]|nr:50S ribosomal protein L5 [Candidatus Paceibacterota bacterium]
MYKSRLKEKYTKEVAPDLKKALNYSSVMAVPKVEKVVVNVGLGTILRNGDEDLKNILGDIEGIVGQKPVITKSRKAVAGFKIREGVPVGAMVTLRGEKMYEFMDRLVNVVLPQVRDFRGVKRKAFDGKGNYNIGLKEQIVFPEITRDNIKTIFGMEVSIITSAKTNDEGYELLKRLGFPIVDKISQ